MTWLESLADWLGVVVIPNGTDRALIGGYVVGDATKYVTVENDAVIAPAGWRAFPPPATPQPGLYRATKGVPSERYVLYADAQTVRYSDDRPGVREIGVGSWRRWARVHRARVVPTEEVFGSRLEEVGDVQS